jgi:hypothetical protein
MYANPNRFTEQDKEKKKHLMASYEVYRTDPVVRLLMTGAGKGGSVSGSEWRSWAENILNSSLDDVTVNDAQWVNAQTQNLLRASKKSIFSDSSSLREWMIKAATLPADLFQYHGLGRIHERISEADQIKEERASGLDSKIRALETSVQKLMGISIKEGREVFDKVNEDVEMYGARYRTVKDNKNSSKAAVETARVEFEQAKERMRIATHHSSAKANPAARAVRLIAEYLNGEPHVYLENGDISRLVAKLGEQKKSGVDYGAVRGVVEQARDLTISFKNILQESKVKLRDMLEYELQGQFPEGEAREMANQITFFKEEEAFYPRNNLISLYQRVDGILKAKQILTNGKREGIIEQINDLVAEQRTAHTMQRKGNSTLINYNMFDVLKIYGKEVYDHAHAAEVGHIGATFARQLSSLDVMKKAIDNPNAPEIMYANSVRRLLMAHMNQIFEKKAATFADEALCTISAFQVMAKLTNPSTTINNRLEGVLQYISYSGALKVGKLRELRETYKDDINDAMKEAHTDFVAGEILDIANLSKNSNVRKILSESDLIDSGELQRMHMVQGMGAVRQAVSKFGSKALGLVMWSKSENANRKEAFELGAAEAAHFVNQKWRDQFMQGKWTKFLETNYSLDPALIKAAREGGEVEKAALFKQFKNRYIMRMGYRSMFQTQFQYSESARNYMDLNAKTSWITMFQHYPRSLTSTILWAMNDVKSLYQVGGLKALRGEITSKKFGEDRDGFGGRVKDTLAVNHRLNHMLTLGGIATIRQLIRAGTGFTLFNILSLPLGNILSDLYSYWVDDEPT